MQRMVVELGDGGHGSAVLRVNQRQVFDVQDFDDVGPLLLVHRDASVAALHDLGHGVEVQHGRGGQHEAVFQRGQDVLHGFGPESAFTELHLDELIIRIVHTSPNHFHGFLTDADGAHVPVQDQVQQEAERTRKWTRQDETDLGQPYQTRCHLEPITRTYNMRNQLSQEEYEEATGEHSGHDGPIETVQQDAEHRVTQSTNEQERTNQNVSSPPDGLEALGRPLFIL